MAIKHTAVSYYGMNYVEHAIADFKEMKEHGCDTVILAITEFDMDFWFPNINNIVKAAHDLGLRVIADPWGIGKYFGGEQVSLFLQNNIHHRQVSAYTGEVLNAACFNTNSFRDYFRGLCLKLARETEVDGFFWDEPHYAYPKSYASITGGAGDDWACRCPECMKKFEAYFGNVKLSAITPIMVQGFIDDLCAYQVETKRAFLIADIQQYIKSHCIQIKETFQKAEISRSIYFSATNGHGILIDNAEKICKALGIDFKKYFSFMTFLSIMS